MAKAEAARPDGIEAVAIVTPNHMHAGPAIAFLEAGIHVICDKPLTVSLAEARRMQAAVEKSSRIFALTHNYTGYPLVRRMREMVRTGDLGVLRKDQVNYRTCSTRNAPAGKNRSSAASGLVRSSHAAQSSRSRTIVWRSCIGATS